MGWIYLILNSMHDSVQTYHHGILHAIHGYSELWLPYNKDLFDLPLYEVFMRSRPYLLPLLYSAAEVPQYVRRLDRLQITEVTVGDRIRRPGSLSIPDADSLTYVAECHYSH